MLIPVPLMLLCTASPQCVMTQDRVKADGKAVLICDADTDPPAAALPCVIAV